MSKLENSSLSSGQIWRQVADPRGSISQRLPRFTPNQNQGASTPYRHFPSRKNILRNKKNILWNNKIFYGIKNICTHSVVVGVGSVVRGRGGAGSAAGAGEVDGAVGGVLCLHLRPAPHLHAVSALPVRISLRDAVRLILKRNNNLNSCISKDYFIANSWTLISSYLKDLSDHVIICPFATKYPLPELHMFCCW